ncbi:ABC transporter permease subunit [Rhizobium leguminosarum]|nr:ABC transporter permease subunit [Rhizobium leguminosarum]MBY5571927.1 ABC transporter permease subunit [Rhizobium leguminosarum]MBY5577041.1 ABC transporter permease subunit [Rhizobium leguminosarum]
MLRGTFRTLFLLPMVVPAVVLGVGMQVLLARLGLTNSCVGVITLIQLLPFHSLSSVLAEHFPESTGKRSLQRKASASSPWIVFRRVTLPLAMPGILSGAVLAFATSLDEVVLTQFVAGPNQRTLAREMFSSIRENVSPAIATAAFLFIAATVAVGLALALLRSLRTDARQGKAGPERARFIHQTCNHSFRHLSKSFATQALSDGIDPISTICLMSVKEISFVRSRFPSYTMTT